MANIKSIAEVITIGDATVYLMGNDNALGSLFGARLTKKSSTVLIAYVTDALRWQNLAQPTDTTLRGTAQYLIWLCGIYGAQAQSNSGGGTVIPIQPPASPSRIDFYVTDSTLVATGQNTVTILQFIGYNLQFDRGNQPQSIATDGASTYFSWDKNTGTFTCFGAAAEGELFSLIPYI